MSAPGFYESDDETVQAATQKLLELEKMLEIAFARWDELEA